MHTAFKDHLNTEIQAIEAAGLYKQEQLISTAQGSHVGIDGGKQLLNLCSNNYLGLAQNSDVRAAAQKGIEKWGYGMASVRFICGTQSQHKALEAKLSDFLGMEDTILYPSCFDANGGLFEVLLSDQDAVISDELNHASIIDGIRLCKAKRFRYRNNDMNDLEIQLQAADKQSARFKLISTDGVFSMDGTIARLDEICALADKYDAIVHFDDCHATGFLGASGKGTHEYRNCMERVDIITSTLGKALGGASGGFTSASKEIVTLLRQRSRPYLFSNTVAPPVVAGALKAIDIASQSAHLREQLAENTHYFRNQLADRGFMVASGEHPIIPIMLGDARIAAKFSAALLNEGVYAVAFSYPVVPKGKARIRLQMSACLSRDDLDFALAAFTRVKKQLAI